MTLKYHNIVIYYDTCKNNEKIFPIMSTLQNYYYLKLDFQKVDQHTGGKWLIHSIKHRKDNQLQSLQLPFR